MILTNSDCQVISGIKSIVLLFLEDFLVADQSKWIKGAASLSLPMYSGLRNSVHLNVAASGIPFSKMIGRLRGREREMK